jgi:hypothetical protein
MAIKWVAQNANGTVQNDTPTVSQENVTHEENITQPEDNTTDPFTPAIQPSYLKIITTPQKCTVLVDGIYAGESPINSYEVTSGSHTVSVTMKDYEEKGETVDVDEGETKEIHYTLDKIEAPTQGDSNPEETPIDTPTETPNDDKYTTSEPTPTGVDMPIVTQTPQPKTTKPTILSITNLVNKTLARGKSLHFEGQMNYSEFTWNGHTYYMIKKV